MSGSIEISEKQLLYLLDEHMDYVYSKKHLNTLTKKILEILSNHPSEFLDWDVVDAVSKKYKKLDAGYKKDNELNRIENEKLYDSKLKFAINE